MSNADVDYGPLTGLIGTWSGDKGMDVAPEPEGREESPYYETIVFEAGGDVTNADSQVLAVVAYRQVVQRRSNDEVFHHQLGYWLWDPETRTVVQSLTIPRAVCCLAGGRYSAEPGGAELVLRVAAALGDPDWGILQSPFMRDHAKTLSFEYELTLAGDTLHYAETTALDIYGGEFAHTDENTLERAR